MQYSAIQLEDEPRVEIAPAHPAKKAHSQKKYCRQCWRHDVHVPIAIPSVVVGFTVIATFGLVLFFRPSRCVCCGTVRVG
jgi:hypothetical protein